jgi:hypothetical protein
MKAPFRRKKTIVAIVLIMTAAFVFAPAMTGMVADCAFAKDKDKHYDKYKHEDHYKLNDKDRFKNKQKVVHSVPDASIAWLLGPALLLFGLLGRRKL